MLIQLARPHHRPSPRPHLFNFLFCIFAFSIFLCARWALELNWGRMTESNELYLPYSLFVILFFSLLLPLLLFASHFVFNLPLGYASVCVRVCVCWGAGGFVCGVFLLRFLFHIVDNRALLRCCCPTYLHRQGRGGRARRE